ncbi:MAG: hypothetical protein AAGA31_20500, partial [Bacteroidota bacterium]
KKRYSRMNAHLRTLLLLGVGAEIIIFLFSYLFTLEMSDTFRYAARYSGRLSALVFLWTFYQYAISFSVPLADNRPLRNWLTLFAVLHLIHFGFLVTNVYLNEIPLEGVKIAGGALAYLMIVLAPFGLHRLNVKFQLVYFYYVSLVMILTYVARAKGDFEGAEPSWFHYLAIIVFIGCCIFFGWRIWKVSKVKMGSHGKQ